MDTETRTALAVARAGFPVFPVNPKTKRPALSNAALGRVLGKTIKRGEGGVKAATCDQKIVKALWKVAPGSSVGVPMGKATGLVAVDVDLYKGQHVRDWLEHHRAQLGDTRTHRTQSGGLHYLYMLPGRKLPGKVVDGVDIKAEGGYVVWPPSAGYSIEAEREPCAFPVSILGTTGDSGGGSGFSGSGDPDEVLVHRLVTASDFHDSLRTLSARMVTQGQAEEEVLRQLRAVMDASVAAAPGHARHEDWAQRRAALPRMVDGAAKKYGDPTLGMDLEQLAGLGFTDLDYAAESRQLPFDGGELLDITPDRAARERVAAIEWLLLQVLPASSLVSLAGNSNVGKTRFLAALAMNMAAGTTALMALPECDVSNVLWVANEEQQVDIHRRLRAVALRYQLQGKDGHVYVRGKERGALRVVSVDENGRPKANDEVIEWLIRIIHERECRLCIADPYVTLGLGLDENSAAVAECVNDALQLVSSETGCTVLHAHHTPKDRSQMLDWYRGSTSAWRGSGAIFSSLDMGLTLAQWVPPLGSAQQKTAYNRLAKEYGRQMSRWIVLDMAKLREGEGVDHVVYRMEGQALPEGMEIGVVYPATELEAQAAYAELQAGVIAKGLQADEE